METHDHKSVTNEPPTEGNQAAPDEQQKNACLTMPEREVLRRLWRIYQMALAAASHAEEK